MFQEIAAKYWEWVIFYLPFGIIGAWRWGVWLIRKTISLFYVQPGGEYKATLSVVTPVYNEEPELFQKALESWKQNKADEIIAVIDHSNQNLVEQFQKFAEGFPGAKVIVTKKPGKRQALADGIKASKSEIVALVDSDTVWSPDIKEKILGPFSDPKVGGLVTRQDVLEANTISKKLFKMLLDDRYLLEYPFLATISNSLLCLSGRTAVYRKKALKKQLRGLVNDTFWGKKMISGDDKTLTRLVQKDGWKTRYLRDVRVYTDGAPTMSSFLKQKLRWTRNGLRSDSKFLFSLWAWRNHKVLAVHMLDKFISPIMLLLGPIYLGFAIYNKHWGIVSAIVLWWILSRTIKLFPHFRENPEDILLIPVYIIFSFYISIIKIYALVTIDEQGWITRWDKKRLIQFGLLKRTASYLATFMLLFFLLFIVFNLKKNALIIAEYSKKEEKPSIFTPDMDRMSDEEIENYKDELIEKNVNDKYAYYVVIPGDTQLSLRQKFNLTGSGRILDGETKQPMGIFSSMEVGKEVAFSIEDLRNPMDKNTLGANSFLRQPVVSYEASSNTIYIKKGGSVATLSRINQLLPSAYKKYLTKGENNEWTLRANLYVGKNVNLVVDGDEVSTLKLKSQDDGFIWVRSESGNILINNTKIISWDENSNTYDNSHANGRAYITAKNSGRMDVLNSEIGYLGYSGLPKRGGLFGGSYGISWKIKNNGFRQSMLTGVVINSKFHNNYFGLYTYGTTGMLVRDNEFYDNVEYGVDPHDDSNNMLIENNHSHDNGDHGIIISKRCFNNMIVNNLTHNNRLHGIMLDRSSNNNLVANNVSYGNVDGVAIYESNENLILSNDLRKNISGIRANAESKNNFFSENKIKESSRGIYLYGGSSGNIAYKNEIRDNKTGITLKGASGNLFVETLNPGENEKDGNITVDSYGNNIQK